MTVGKKIQQILKSKQIDPSYTIFSITAGEAISNLIDALNEFGLKVNFGKFSKDEMEKILSDYASAVINYHPDGYHQERITFIKNAETVTKYGLTNNDLDMLDFT